jgi:hypothetical protein
VSTELKELLRNRFKEELKRIGISASEAARILGEKNKNRIGDVLGGRVRMPADFLANAVVMLDMDGSYVLTGQRSISVDIVKKLMQRANELDDMIDQEITPDEKISIVCSVLKTSKHLGQEIDQQAFIAALHAVTGD